MAEPRDREADDVFAKVSAALALAFFLLVAAIMFTENSSRVGDVGVQILALLAGLLGLGTFLWMTASVVNQAQEGQWRSVFFRMAIMALLCIFFIVLLAVATVVHIAFFGFEPEVFQ